MKNILILILLTFHLSLTAQTEKYEGKYETRFDLNNGGVIEYKLSLNSDGTFLFHSYRKIDPTQSEENLYGQGEWKIEKDNALYFYADQNNDLDESHTLNFTNTKVRYYTQSPRDKSERIIKTSLKFYDSNITWAMGMKLFKKE